MIMLLFFFIAFFTFTSSSASAFMIQISPPPVVKNFACDCSGITTCTCRFADISVFIDLDTRDWQRHADKSLLGSKVCGARCIAAIGQVVRVSVPFLSIQTLERVEKSAVMSKKKTIGRTEKSASTVSPGGGGVGAGYATEESRGVAKEKSLSVLKSKAKSQGIDLTTFFILELTRAHKGNVTVENVFEVLEELTLANARGQLESYLAEFFAK